MEQFHTEVKQLQTQMKQLKVNTVTHSRLCCHNTRVLIQTRGGATVVMMHLENLTVFNLIGR